MSTSHSSLAIRWFASRAGQTVSWQDIQRWGGVGYLASAAKGIYKPADSDYALSIRQTLKSPYHDEEPVFHSDGGWTYRYAQEGDASDPKTQELSTNRALAKCMADRIPVAVLRQVSTKPNTRYCIMGLALVESWKDGIFTLRGTDLSVDPPRQWLLREAADAYDPQAVSDARLTVMRAVTQRQGQAGFRSGLLLAYCKRPPNPS